MNYKFTDQSNTVVADGNGWSGLVTAPEVQEWIAAGKTPEPADLPDPKEAIRAQIAALEAQNLLPRVTREFMLLSFATTAAGMGVDPNTNVAYVKVKALDDQIAALRAQL